MWQDLSQKIHIKLANGYMSLETTDLGEAMCSAKADEPHNEHLKI